MVWTLPPKWILNYMKVKKGVVSNCKCLYRLWIVCFRAVHTFFFQKKGMSAIITVALTLHLVSASFCGSWCDKPRILCQAVCGNMTSYNSRVEQLNSLLVIKSVELDVLNEEFERQRDHFNAQMKSMKITQFLSDSNTTLLEKVNDLQDQLAQCENKWTRLRQSVAGYTAIYYVAVIVLLLKKFYL